MIFAKRVFQAAGVWGVVVIILGYVAFFFGGDDFAVYTNHPEYVHGFFLVTFAWQIAFFIIATDPVRYRLLMLAAMLEKFPFTIAVFLLYAFGAVGVPVLVIGGIDGAFGALFSIAYIVTERGADEE